MRVPELKQKLQWIKLEKPHTFNKCEVLLPCDYKKFIDWHFSFLENNPGNRLFMPYYNRLIDIYAKNILKSG